MQCRKQCGACCIAPAISQPFYLMPHGKPAGQRCVHLSIDLQCAIFDRPQRPKCCAQFQAELEFCGESVEQALTILTAVERLTAN